MPKCSKCPISDNCSELYGAINYDGWKRREKPIPISKVQVNNCPLQEAVTQIQMEKDRREY